MRLSDDSDETRGDGLALSADLPKTRDHSPFWRDFAASWGVVVLLLVGIGLAVSLDHSVKISDSARTWQVPPPLGADGRPSERSANPETDEPFE